MLETVNKFQISDNKNFSHLTISRTMAPLRLLLLRDCRFYDQPVCVIATKKIKHLLIAVAALTYPRTLPYLHEPIGPMIPVFLFGFDECLHELVSLIDQNNIKVSNQPFLHKSCNVV